MALHPGSLEAILRRCGAWNESLMACIDAGDPRCNVGSQIVYDLSPEKHIFTRGLDLTATVADPTPVSSSQFQMATSATDFSRPPHWSFDGGDLLICQAAPVQRWSNLSTAVPSGSGVGIANAYSAICLFAAPTGTGGELVAISMGTGTGSPITHFILLVSNVVQIEMDGGAAGQTINTNSSNTISTNTWTFAAGSTSAGRQIIRMNGTTTTGTDTNTVAMGNASGTSLCIGGRINDSSPTTVTAALPATSRIMLAAAWFDFFMEEEMMKNIQRELQAWRVTGLA